MKLLGRGFRVMDPSLCVDCESFRVLRFIGGLNQIEYRAACARGDCDNWEGGEVDGTDQANRQDAVLLWPTAIDCADPGDAGNRETVGGSPKKASLAEKIAVRLIAWTFGAVTWLKEQWRKELWTL